MLVVQSSILRGKRETSATSGCPDAGDHTPAGGNKIVQHAVRVGAVGDAGHGVAQALVEAGEEVEAVLAGQIPASTTGAGPGNAPGFAAEDHCALVDVDLKAALG
jgi:hypothetical protein